MADDFLAQLLGNPNRTRVLRLFVFNQPQILRLPQIGKRAGVHKSLVGREVRALEKMDVIKKTKFEIRVGREKRAVSGKQKESAWTFNTDFKYASALSKFVHEVTPLEYKSIVGALKGSGRLAAVILSGSFMGDPTRPADLIVAADALNESRVEAAIRGLEPEFGREIRYAVFSTPEFRYRLTIEDRLIRDTLDYPHLVLLDKTRLL